jgi:hypothetical protein
MGRLTEVGLREEIAALRAQLGIGQEEMPRVRHLLAAAVVDLSCMTGRDCGVGSSDRQEALRLMREALLLLAPPRTPPCELPTRAHGKLRKVAK